MKKPALQYESKEGLKKVSKSASKDAAPLRRHRDVAKGRKAAALF